MAISWPASVTSIAIGFATKNILNHLISGVLILWQQPFRIGDYIMMKDEEGWVEYIGVRANSLKRGSGEVILIPNGDIYSNPFIYAAQVRVTHSA